MIDQQINEQLGLLQKELERLKSATQYIEDAKGNSDRIIVELATIQQNYAVYTDKIFNIYKQYIEDIKKNTNIEIKDGVLKFETTGNKIDITNKEKLIEIKRLLEQYKKIVEATDELVKTLEKIDFPAKLSDIDNNIQATNSALNETKKRILDNHELLIQRLNKQDREIKLSKIVLFIICGLIVIGVLTTVFIK